MWHYIPVEKGTITFSVWRTIDGNSYKVVGTNTVVVNGKVKMAIYLGLLNIFIFEICSS